MHKIINTRYTKLLALILLVSAFIAVLLYISAIYKPKSIFQKSSNYEYRNFADWEAENKAIRKEFKQLSNANNWIIASFDDDSNLFSGKLNQIEPMHGSPIEVAPFGGYVAYFDKDGDLTTFDITSGFINKLKASEGWHFLINRNSLTWSEDGELILFMNQDSSTEKQKLYSVDKELKTEAQYIIDAHNISFPKFSPDKGSIAYIKDKDTLNINYSVSDLDIKVNNSIICDFPMLSPPFSWVNYDQLLVSEKDNNIWLITISREKRKKLIHGKNPVYLKGGKFLFELNKEIFLGDLDGNIISKCPYKSFAGHYRIIALSPCKNYFVLERWIFFVGHLGKKDMPELLFLDINWKKINAILNLRSGFTGWTTLNTYKNQ